MKQDSSKIKTAKTLYALGHKRSDSLLLLWLSVLASILFRLRPYSDKWIGSQYTRAVHIEHSGQVITILLRIQDIHMLKEVFVREDYALTDVLAPTGHVIDLGGNIGLSSLYFTKIAKSSQPILSLEPSNYNYPILVANTKTYPNISTVKKAISSKSGSQPWREDALGYNSQFARSKEASTEHVEVVSMHELISMHDIQQIALLKIDIEGAEEKLFEGDISWLHMVDTLLIEVHDGAFVDQLHTKLSQAGLIAIDSVSSIHQYTRPTKAYM